MRAINLSIAVLAGVFLAVAYWFAWRPLAQTSGGIAAPVSTRATVARDALGVPHISAGSWEDAIFLQGYVTAQDRLWQMDALRRLAAGELAEVLGPSQVENDRMARRLHLPGIAEAQEKTLTPEAKAVYAAYARGVNYFLETHRGNLPLEFTLLGYQPRPWRIRDTVLIGLHMYRTLTTSWQEEIHKQHMLSKGDPRKVALLYPPLTGAQAAPGSNAWVVSGAHTASGKPILAGDPHLEYNIPSPWYLVHLRAPDLDVTGASLPGVPAVILGHNGRIAWSVTNLEFDVQDLIRENFEPQTGRYQVGGRMQQATPERDVIAVKGQAPEEATWWITRDGPIFLNDQNEYYALRWAAAQTPGADFPFLAIDRAQNWEEFNQALQRYSSPAQNFVYADTSGNIGYHVAGRLPIRHGCAGDVPTDGVSGACQWQGFIPYDDLPHLFNPPSGIIATANNDPFPADYPYPVAGFFSPPYRVNQILALLHAKDQWKPEQMLSIQKDVYSALSYFVARETVKAWDRKPSGNPQLRDAVELLRNWNGQMEKGTAAPMIATLLFAELRQAAAHSAAPGAEGEYTSRTAPVAIEKLLRERPPGWFPDYDALLRDSLAAAIAAGEKSQGSKVSRWDYGQLTELRIPHPVDSQLPVIGKYFGIGPVEISGGPYTVKQSTPRLGPSMRMVIDLANLDNSEANITIGESGQPFSKHYKDQWNAYYNGVSFPMQFQKVDAKESLIVNPE
jgi:penicillin G amidase